MEVFLCRDEAGESHRLTAEEFDKPVGKLLSRSSIPISPPAQHHYQRHLQTWLWREESWSVMEQSERAAVSLMQPLLLRWADTYVCLSPAGFFIIQLLILYSSWRADPSDPQNLEGAALRHSSCGPELRQSHPGYPSKTRPHRHVELAELILSLIILFKIITPLVERGINGWWEGGGGQMRWRGY